MRDRLPDAFWARVVPTPDGCWLWTGRTDRNGYGQVSWNARPTRLAHRVAYTALAGEIPSGLQLDHLCRRKGCVNPEHLEPVTASENVQRERDSREVCPSGHPVAEHAYFWRGIRHCRECRRLRLRARYQSDPERFARERREARQRRAEKFAS